MSAELANLLLSFQPDAPELKQKLDYHKQSRSFVQEVSNVSGQHFLKGADTSQDVLEVPLTRHSMRPLLTFTGAQPRG